MFRFQPLSARSGTGVVQCSRSTTSTSGGAPTTTTSSSERSTSTSVTGRQQQSANGRRSKKEMQTPKPSTMFINNVHHGPMPARTISTTVIAGTAETSFVTPTEYAKSMLRLGDENNQVTMEEIKVQYKFVQPTDTLLDSYTIEAVNTVRSNDIEKMRALFEKGQNFNACNRNGETLLHMACRCCSVELVRFLIEVVKVDVNVIDSVGRNVLHDICWRHRLDVEMMVLFIDKINPYMFVLCDNRGHTCFDYCRKEHYEIWVDFLKEHGPKIIEQSKLLVHDSSNQNGDSNESMSKTVVDESQLVADESITIAGKVFIPFRNVNNVSDAHIDSVVAITSSKEHPGRMVKTLKRKDSSFEETLSFSNNAESKESVIMVGETMSKNNIGCRQETSMNEPLKKKSYSSPNLIDLANEESNVMLTNSDCLHLMFGSSIQEQNVTESLRRIQSATCPLATLAAVAAVAAALEENNTKSNIASSALFSKIERK